MQIVNKPVDELIPYINNAKKHPEEQVQKIAGAIKEFGFLVPILIRPDNEIICGHGRIEAAKKAGIDSVPCIIANGLSDAQVKAFRIAENRLARSDWNDELLSLEMQHLRDVGYALPLTGFSMKEIDDIIGSTLDLGADVKSETDPRSFGDGDSNTETITKPGDIWKFGDKYRVGCLDSLSQEHVDMLLAGESPVLAVTDPPYGVCLDGNWRNSIESQTKYGGSHLRDQIANDDKIDFSQILNIFMVDVAYIWHGGKHAHIVGHGIENAGFEIIAQIIWAKNISAMSRGDYHWQHEPCYYCVRKGKQHNWQGARDQHTIWEAKVAQCTGKKNTDDWDMNDNEDKMHGHPACKPVSLYVRPILNNSMAGDLIVDAFLGSGTCVIAAHRTGRRCFGIEIMPRHCDSAIRRIIKETGIIPVNHNGKKWAE